MSSEHGEMLSDTATADPMSVDHEGTGPSVSQVNQYSWFINCDKYFNESEGKTYRDKGVF